MIVDAVRSEIDATVQTQRTVDAQDGVLAASEGLAFGIGEVVDQRLIDRPIHLLPFCPPAAW